MRAFAFCQHAGYLSCIPTFNTKSKVQTEHNDQDNEPHLSLMNFTFVSDENLFIMTTRRDTKKFADITTNPKVAILVHDFSCIRNLVSEQGFRKTQSVTLNGVATVREGADVDRYKQLHLANNPAYPQFILGDSIAVITVAIDRAQICDINDRVTKWPK
eukprot:Colp12_sorted_trinity150504_noHs@35275